MRAPHKLPQIFRADYRVRNSDIIFTTLWMDIARQLERKVEGPQSTWRRSILAAAGRWKNRQRNKNLAKEYNQMASNSF